MCIRDRYSIIPRREIDPYSPEVSINDSIFTVEDGVTVRQDTVLFTLPRCFISHGNSVTYNLVSLTDIHGCAMRDSYPGEFTLDFFPPVAMILNPHNGDTITDSSLIDSTFSIDFIVSDGPAGVDRDTISILVEFNSDSTRLFPISSPYLQFIGDTLRLRFAQAFPSLTADIDSIMVTLQNIQDLSSGCGANIAEPVTLLLYYNPSTDIKEASLPREFDMRVFPNPFNSAVCFHLQSPDKAELSLEIYNIMGQKVYHSDIKFHFAGVKNIIWQPEKLSSGLYYYRLKGVDEVVQGELIYLK